MFMEVDAASFQGAPQLQTLHLQDDEGLLLSPGCFHQLTALTALHLICCDLRSIPDLASVATTLCVLDLSLNDKLQLSHVAAATILQCSRLEEFGMYGSASLDIETVEHVVELLVAFPEKHGRNLHFFDDQGSHESCCGLDLRWPPDGYESTN